ncbi:MAG TPA: hypothetical protein VKB19_02615 [Pedobacter sp.]|nr:hypothetical protein [Pedobacter sp.]
MSFIFYTPKHLLSAFKAVAFSTILFSGLTAAAQNQIPGKIHFGLVYPLSSNGTHAPLDTNNLSVNLIAGVSSAERGVAFAGLSNVVLDDVNGSMFAGFSNHVKKTANGALFAGFANTYGGGQGPAFAGFTNVASGDVNGAQFAGFANIAKEVTGAQVGGFINVAKNLQGAQFAGFANIAKDVSISQFGGFINVAKDVKGSQFAGFINIAKKVKGAQIAGFINIADSSDCPIGIINFIKKGEKSIGVTVDENQTTMLSFRSGGRVLYGIIGAGYNFKNDDAIYGIEAGLGAHFFESRYFRLNTELISSTLTDFEDGSYFKASLRVMPAFKVASFLEIFAGPSMNFVTTNTLEGEQLRKKYLKKWEGKWDEDFRGLYLGYTGGIHILF